jgi:hypothetical protein
LDVRFEGGEGVVDVAVEREANGFGGDGLRERLSGVTDFGERVDHEHDVGLRAGHAEMPAGVVVAGERVGDAAGGRLGEERGDFYAGGGEMVLDPGLGGGGRGGVGPEVELVGDGCCFFGGCGLHAG